VITGHAILMITYCNTVSVHTTAIHAPSLRVGVIMSHVKFTCGSIGDAADIADDTASGSCSAVLVAESVISVVHWAHCLQLLQCY
jgi:hypothetical protein